MALGSVPPVTLIFAAFVLLAGPAAAQSPDLPPAPFKDEAPFAVAVVEMDDGPRITTQVADWTTAERKSPAIRIVSNTFRTTRR